MYIDYPQSSMVTAIIPEAHVQGTILALNQAGHDVMNWCARGSLKDTRWYRRLLPAFCPEKGVLRAIVCNDDVDDAIRIIVESAKLDRRAAGAVFAIPTNNLTIGGLFHASCKFNQSSAVTSDTIKENLDVIHCIVDKNKADHIAHAAIDAGSHGPVVHYGEGRGLRDRLGWLRITKQQEKEVLTVVTDNRKADRIFNAMAAAGNIDLPGGGFMYQMPVEKGLFNLPSFYAGQRQQADLQQIIGAIDHLMGHEDWRDAASFAGRNATKFAGLSFLKRAANPLALEPQCCISVIVDREHEEQITDMMLNAGASGISTNYAQLHSSDDKALHNEVKLVNEYSTLRCVTSESTASQVLSQVKAGAASSGIEDACLFTQPVSRVLTYQHHPRIEQRRNASERDAA